VPLRAALLLLALVGCAPTIPVQADPPVTAQDAAGQDSLAVNVNATRMVAGVRPAPGAPCSGVVYPLDGRAAFEATVRASLAGAPPLVRRVRVFGERLAFSYGAGPAMLGQVMLAPTATITARLHIHTTRGRGAATIQANGTGQRSLNGFVGCEVLAQALAEAYREALRDLSSQISERMYRVGSSVAAVPRR